MANSQKEFEKSFENTLNNMNVQELMWLEKMVIHRIKILSHVQTLDNLARLKVGDCVTWKNVSGSEIKGTIIRLNSKTASVKVSGDGEGYWRVSPVFLSKC